MKKKAEIANPIAKLWFEKATKFIEAQPKDDNTLHILKYGSKEYYAWVYYFAKLGWRPVVIQMMIDGLRDEATMPAAYPEWFDLGYMPPDVVPEYSRRPVPPRADRESYEELKARFGPTWGLQIINPAKPKPKWERPTHDVLRAHYGTRKEEP